MDKASRNLFITECFWAQQIQILPMNCQEWQHQLVQSPPMPCPVGAHLGSLNPRELLLIGKNNRKIEIPHQMSLNKIKLPSLLRSREVSAPFFWMSTLRAVNLLLPALSPPYKASTWIQHLSWQQGWMPPARNCLHWCWSAERRNNQVTAIPPSFSPQTVIFIYSSK